MTFRFPVHQRIAAVLPTYSSQGDSSRILSTDGLDQLIPHRIRTVLQRLARSRAIDLAQLRRQTAEMTCRRLLQPLPLAPGLVLIPLKVRQPRVIGDPTMGYVNVHAITSVKAEPAASRQSIIHLRGGGQVHCLWTATTVQRLLTLARLTNAAADPLLMIRAAEDRPAGDPLQQLTHRLAAVVYDILSLKDRATQSWPRKEAQ